MSSDKNKLIVGKEGFTIPATKTNRPAPPPPQQPTPVQPAQKDSDKK